MSIRDVMEKNRLATVAAAIAVLAVAAGVTYWLNAAPAPQTSEWYYDLSKGDVFPVPLPTPETVTAPGGGAAVRAYVFSCGDCARDHFVGYLESYTEEAQKAQRSLRQMNRGVEAGPGGGGGAGARAGGGANVIQTIEQGRLIAEPSTSPQWVSAGDEEGRDLTSKLNQKCGASPLKVCHP